MPKKNIVKKKPIKKTVGRVPKKESYKKEECECGSNIGLIKFSSMAFILFLITVWPAAGESLMKVHWGWYLGLTIILSVGAVKAHHHNWCKRQN
jgi:hypothetical protein